MSDAPGVLYVVATPIGNLGDITVRALETLKLVQRVAAEDTRRTRALLSHHGISGKPVDALHEHSSEGAVLRLASLIESGENIALVTDAGTPVVSDPGNDLVQACIQRNLRVIPIPGASAVLTALVGSGLGTGHGFRFMGFLPREGPERFEALRHAAETVEPVVFFEAPGRVKSTLLDFARIAPERPACVARELTKLHEEFARGTVQSLSERDDWMGEVCIVLGARQGMPDEALPSDAALEARIAEELAKGTHAKNIAELLSAWSGRPKRDVYERVVRSKQTHKG